MSLDDRPDAVVVGSGPNGLAGAVTLAQAGLSVHVVEAADTIGGGTRSAELTRPGLIHDICSAVHPWGPASPYLSTLPLADHGLEWAWPEVDLAHPLDGGRVALMYRSLDATAEALGPDGDRWRSIFGPLVERFDRLAPEILQPLLHLPEHPFALARFGLRATLPATALAGRLRSEEARALFAGNAAHVFRPLGRPFSAAAGVMLTVASHAVGWPVAVGGSQSIADALTSLLLSLGGSVETGRRITSLDELGSPGIVLLDTSPGAALDIAGDRLSSAARRAYRRFRRGPGAFKVDLAVENGIPWSRPEVGSAGTVHLGGTIDEIASAELDTHRGRLAPRPFVLVGQQSVCDPSRASGDLHPVWTYAHVPAGYSGDATEAVIAQIERFAPGVRDRIVDQHSFAMGGARDDNTNHVGGDIAGGANSLRQLVFRPRIGLDPYATGAEGVYLCSSSTPPGAGAHGMCGHLAARSALRHLDQKST